MDDREPLAGPGRPAPGAPEPGRCGLGPRLPFLVVSPFAKSDYVDSTVIDQSSVMRFIEYNWGLPALGNGAADAEAGSILSLFRFRSAPRRPLFLNPATGELVARGALEHT